MIKRELTITKAGEHGKVIICHDFSIINQTATHCSIMILGEPVGQDEDGKTKHKIDGCEYGVISWHAKDVEVDENGEVIDK